MSLRELRRAAATMIALGASAGCTSPRISPAIPPTTSQLHQELEWVQLAPGLRVDRAHKVVEFDGKIAVDVHHEDTPIVWLELMVTGPDSREHESLVVTTVRPSLIHAAMLAVGLEPGKPGSIEMSSEEHIQRTPATGAAVRVEFVLDDAEGNPIAHAPASWVSHAQTGEILSQSPSWDGFVFTGSREVSRQGRVWYDANGTGVIIGLTTFGSEVIGPRMTLSHASAVDEAVWIARIDRVPERGKTVRVRVWAEFE